MLAFTILSMLAWAAGERRLPWTACMLWFFFQGYQFEEENPYLCHPDPLSEGVKRMEAGDIPGAVRFFESAVRREPDNQLVRLLKHFVSSVFSSYFPLYLRNESEQ